MNKTEALMNQFFDETLGQADLMAPVSHQSADGGCCEIQSLAKNGWIRCKGLSTLIVYFQKELRFYDGEILDRMPFLANTIKVCQTHGDEIEKAYDRRSKAISEGEFPNHIAEKLYDAIYDKRNE